ncbi:MAG: prepilin-type N-terminal cleavage/methylation domain-containing protein [Planctomycetota bacterium]
MSSSCASNGADSKGFTLIEVLVVIAIIALLIGLLLPSLGAARGASRAVLCQTQMSSRGVACQLFSNDHGGRVATFSWRAGELNNPKYGVAESDLRAAADQAMTLAGDLIGRPLERAPAGVFPFPAGYYLLLRDYESAPPFDASNGCPEDRNRQRWLEAFRTDPTGEQYLDLSNRPFAGIRLDVVLVSGLNSGYFMVESAVSQDRGLMPSNGPAHLSWDVPEGTRLGGRRVSEVAFPSSKAFLYEYQDWHYADDPQYVAYEDSRCHVALFDGSVAARVTASSDVGWDPADPDGNEPTRYIYTPDTAWEPPSRTAADELLGWYRYTRGGLRGRDF